MNNTIWSIELQENEMELYEIIKGYFFSNSLAERKIACESQKKLAELLLASQRIPESRLFYFLKPEYNTTDSRKSFKQIFESNSDSKMNLSDPNFLKYLLYFIEGANLNIDFKLKAEEILVGAEYKDDGCEEFYNYLKSTKSIPKDGNRNNNFSEEIFKLAIDSSVDLISAKRLRSKVMAKKISKT